MLASGIEIIEGAKLSNKQFHYNCIFEIHPRNLT